MAEEKYNLKNPAVKRILQEVKEFQNNPSDDYASLPLEDNIFEWHFAIRGPQDTEFEGGIYHGRILLPADYPFKPPAFMLLTPNGRFETQTKICLSISQHHPEHWQPSWSVRTALVALIAFMPTKPDGALGSLDYPKEERRALAIKSRIAAPKFGNSERQKLIDEVHEEMLKKAHPVPEHLPEAPKESDESVKPAEPVLIKEPEGKPELIEGTPEHNGNADAETSILGEQRQDDIVVSPEIQPEEQPQTSAPQNATPQISLQPSTRHQIPDNDRGLTMLAIGLTVAIIALLLKKLAKLYGIGDMTSLFY